MTEPKVGDWIKATLGASVLIGTVRHMWTTGLVRIKVDGLTWSSKVDIDLAHWAVEVLPFPIPEWLTVPGARGYTDDAVMVRGVHKWQVLRVTDSASGVRNAWPEDAEVAAMNPTQIPDKP